MGVNRGKKFEEVIKQSFEKVPQTAVLRLHDQTNGFKGSTNPCDFVLYKKPYIYFIECKTIHGNTFPLANITDFQWKSLSDVGKVDGVVSGVICWWVDKDVTRFLSIQDLQLAKDLGDKSIRFDEPYMAILGNKKRVFFDYDMQLFFHQIEKNYRRK